MRANPPDAQHPPASDVHPSRLQWMERLSTYRQPIGLAVTLLLFTIALIACRHLVNDLDPDSLRESVLHVPLSALLGALAATAVGFIILLGYEWSASRFADVKLPLPTLAFGGFNAFAIGNAVGLSMLSGGSVRYRLYARNGLGPGEVARMTLFASLSLGCALPVLAAIATLTDLSAAASALRLPPSVLATIAVAILLGCAALLVAVNRRRVPEQPFAHSVLVQFGRRTCACPACAWRGCSC